LATHARSPAAVFGRITRSRRRRRLCECPCGSTCSPATARPGRSNRRRSSTADEARGTGLSTVLADVQIMHDRQARSSASLEVLVPFSTHWPGRAVPGGRPWDDPAAAFRRSTPRFRRILEPGVRPCGFALLRTEVGVAHAGGRAGRSSPFRRAPQVERAKRRTLRPVVLWRSMQARHSSSRAQRPPDQPSGAGSRLPPGMGHAPMRLFARRSATHHIRAHTAWSSERFLPSSRPTALMGFNPFADLLPPAGDATFLRRRAHVSLADSSAPIDFCRGDRPPERETTKCKGDRPGTDFGSTSGLHLPQAIRIAARAVDAILPWALPLAGFRAHDSCIRSGSTPIRIISLRRPLPAPIRSWALARPSQEICAALQRVEGLMPRRPDRFLADRIGSLSEVLHLP